MNQHDTLLAPAAPTARPAAESADDVRKKAIAKAVFTEIHWLMPRDRTVAIVIDGDAVTVTFSPVRRHAAIN